MVPLGLNELQLTAMTLNRFSLFVHLPARIDVLYSSAFDVVDKET
jgi:hypothetical protein